MDNPEKMDQYLEMYNLVRINKWNRKYEEASQKYLSWNCDLKSYNKQKSRTRSKFYQRKRVNTILLKLFQKFAEEEILQSSFCEATIITLISKPDKDTTHTKITGQYHWWP